LEIEPNELRRLDFVHDRQVVKDLVVVAAHVVDGVLVRHVQHLEVAKQVIQRDLHEKRRLPHPRARRHDPDMAASETAVHRLLEDPHGASLAVLFANHRHSRYFFLACSSRCFLTSSSASDAGSGAYRENSMVNSALPCVAERSTVENPNISASGTSASM